MNNYSLENKIAELELELFNLKSGVTTVKQLEESLCESEERFHLLLNNVPFGYHSLDINGNLIEVNQQWLDILGYTNGEVIGRWFGYFLSPAYQDSFRHQFLIFKAEGKVHSEFEMVHKNGNKLYIAFEGKIGYDLNGDFKQTHCILQDITQFKQAEKKQIERAEQFRIISEQIIEMIYMTDNKGIIKYVSKAVEKIFGFTQEEMIGNHFSVFLGENDISKAMSLFQKSLSNVEKDTKHELRMKRKDNSIFVGELSGTVFIKDGLINTLGLIRDITKRRQAQEKLKENETVLQKLNTDKDLFISVLSHDLKSPFNTLLGFSEILKEDIRKLDIDEIEEIANNINKSAQNTYNLLEDLLMWARTQQGKIPFKPQKFSFKNICNDVLKTLNPSANAKNIAINCLTADNLNIFADIDMLKTVLRNLVSNAIKFTTNGGEINISAENNTGNVTISVSDNGIGIKPDNLAKLFDISQVLTTTGTARETGTGLGLLLCKEFVEKHRGKIWVRSVAGQQTRKIIYK